MPVLPILCAIRTSAVAAAILVVAAAIAFVAPAARAETGHLQLHPCTIGKARLPAHCGSLTVYEDRMRRTGRTIGVHITEIDAVHRMHQAVFWNPGGPGADDTSAVRGIADGAFAKELIALRERYDLVFVDNRGTGLSHLIQCNLYPPEHPEYYYKQLFPEQPLRACRAARTRDTNLSMYTTDIAADDLDDVRQALHYPRIVLDGGSYGTMFFLDYVRRHPNNVESVVLQGVAPPGILLIPLEDADGAQKAMSGLIVDCAHDAACSRWFPRFAAHFAAIVRRFDRGPATVRLYDVSKKREQRVILSKEVFADRLRQALYADEAAAYVPYIIEQAYIGNYEPLSRLIEAVTADLGRGLAIGDNLSVTCAEDIPFISERQIERSSAGSYEGDVRVRAQIRACRIWDVRQSAAAFIEPVRSRLPMLLISGAEDPATPAHYGREALRYLPNARQIIVPHASHESESACTDAVIVNFVKTRDAHNVNASCAAINRRPAFMHSMTGFGK